MKHVKAASAGHGRAHQDSSDQKAPAQISRGETKIDAITLLKTDHRKVEKLFAACIDEEDRIRQVELAKQICTELIIHTKLEEEIFYRACREAGVADASLDEAQVEHDGAKVLIADVMNGSRADEFYAAKIKVLSEYIKHHIKEEEKPRSGVFAKAKQAKVDTAALGERMQERKIQLTAQKETLSTSPLEARSLHLQDIHTTQENAQMAKNYQDNRNQGRFSREEDYGTGGRGYSLRGQTDGQQDHDRNQDRGRQGNGRGWQSSDHDRNDRDRSGNYYGVSDRGRDENHHRYSYVTNEDYPDRSASRDMQSRNRDWDEDRNRNRESQSGSRYNYNDDEDYSGSFRTNPGRNQDDRSQQSGQYSQSNYGQNRNQGGYSQGNYGHDDQSRYGQDGGGQYGQEEDYGSRRSQQSQSRGQGRGQQSSQNRYRDDENHDQGYGAYGSSSGPSQRDRDDNDRFTRSSRRNPQYRD